MTAFSLLQRAASASTLAAICLIADVRLFHATDCKCRTETTAQLPAVTASSQASDALNRFANCRERPEAAGQLSPERTFNVQVRRGAVELCHWR
jgi:hypothetical protein